MPCRNFVRGFIFFITLAGNLTLDARAEGDGPPDRNVNAGSVFFDPGKLLRIDSESLALKMRDKRDGKCSFQLVDMRLEANYQQGHIPGAINIPLKKKFRSMAEKLLSRSEDTVLYGYSRDDAACVNGVILLFNKGYSRVFLLDGGIQEWKGELE